MIKYKDVMEKLDAYLETVTLEQLDADLKKAGFDFEAHKKQKDCSQSALNDLVIKRICSEATEDCSPCICRKPHEKQQDLEDTGDVCTKWNYCNYKGRKVRCPKVL